jgi:RNA polymerase sigma-70 factor (ECF subfamily)
MAALTSVGVVGRDGSHVKVAAVTRVWWRCICDDMQGAVSWGYHNRRSAGADFIGAAHRRVDQYRNGDGVLTGHTADDAGLVARVARGDEDALGQLYDRFGQAVYSLCLRVVRDRETAEELTQEAFVRLWRSAASFEPARGQVSTWLLRIAHNLALNELRRRQSRPVVAPDTDWDVASAESAETSGNSDPSLVADLHEQAEVVRRVLGQLPAPQRQAIELAFIGGLYQAEVAAALGAPLGTVKGRIRVGMQRLRELLVAAGIDKVS